MILSAVICSTPNNRDIVYYSCRLKLRVRLCVCVMLLSGVWQTAGSHEKRLGWGLALGLRLQLLQWKRQDDHGHGSGCSLPLALQRETRPSRCCTLCAFIPAIRCESFSSDVPRQLNVLIVSVKSAGLSRVCRWRDCECSWCKVHKRRIWGECLLQPLPKPRKVGSHFVNYVDVNWDIKTFNKGILWSK